MNNSIFTRKSSEQSTSTRTIPKSGVQRKAKKSWMCRDESLGKELASSYSSANKSEYRLISLGGPARIFSHFYRRCVLTDPPLVLYDVIHPSYIYIYICDPTRCPPLEIVPRLYRGNEIRFSCWRISILMNLVSRDAFEFYSTPATNARRYRTGPCYFCFGIFYVCIFIFAPTTFAKLGWNTTLDPGGRKCGSWSFGE